MKVPPLFAAGLLLLGAYTSSKAAVYNYIFDVSEQTTDYYLNVEGNPVLTGTGGSPAGDYAFVSNITAGFTQFYLHLNRLFQRDVGDEIKIGELESITYWTQAGDPANGLDWAIRLYTIPAAGQTSGWFNKRFNGMNPNASDTGWHEWSADTANWFKSYTYYNGKTQTDSTINYSLSQITENYGNDEILYFSLYAGSDKNTKAIYNQIDNITIKLTNGDEVHVKLVPEPTGFVFCAAGGFAYALFRRRRLR